MAIEISRRDFLSFSARAAAAASLGAVPLAQSADPFEGGVLVGTRPLFGRSAENPLERMIGTGLDARLLTDLSTLTPGSLVTPNERFYIRTQHPERLGRARRWNVSVKGLVHRPLELSIEDLVREAAPMGTHLLECAGNNNPRNFGLMSAAEWSGVPIARVLDRVQRSVGRTRVMVSGVDDDSRPSRTSVAGASWVFSADDLDRSGAFLATGMNGVALPLDHGFPVRLVVPRWYGCACIKWVQAIALVPDDAPATSQMQEFASRTFQDGVPSRARDYRPAVMETAAFPVRVEKWVVGGRVLYRVVGIIWGGARPTNALAIRFKSGERYMPVTHCPMPASTTTWSLWWHAWRPPSRGRYDIVLKVEDPQIPTPRLDVYFYVRSVEIDEI